MKTARDRTELVDDGRASGLPWHARDSAGVLGALESTEAGLSEAEAARRLERDGANRLPAGAVRGPVRRFLDQFANILIHVLLAAAAITAVIGHWIDAAVIAGVVVINAVIGFVQEGRAERALAAIRDILSPHAQVRRSGRVLSIDAAEIVPGDVVLLKAGDRVPADLHLLGANALQAQEAMLTGESQPVDKLVGTLAADTVLGDRSNMAYAGTTIVHGLGHGVAVATGPATELGRIGTLIGNVERVQTPLLLHFERFARQLTFVILAFAAATCLFGILYHGAAVSEMFLAGVGLAVAAIPEGLPAILTISFAIGVTRMASRRAIVRRLPAVETLGAVTVICTDKTGTLTRNELVVQRVVTANGDFRVSDEDGGGGIVDSRGADAPPDAHPDLSAALDGALHCNDAEMRNDEGRLSVMGNPVDRALVLLGAGADPLSDAATGRDPTLDLVPFDSTAKFMATLHRGDGDGLRLYVKGAPERVLEMCAHEMAADGTRAALRKDHWADRISALAEAGLRVLALAETVVEGDARAKWQAPLEGDLTMVALFGISDPPRAEAIDAIVRCREAGITVKMITGDHAATARAIATDVGLDAPERVMTGRELDALGDDELAAAAKDIQVFARTTPEHKLRLVTALQAQGEIVAMTGDGVNDAPALRRADIGVAMGVKGSEVAKEAAEIVLLDDNFATIAAAVAEGRTVYDNLKKSIMFILPTSAGEAMVIVLAVLSGQLLPITPVQILWVNMITTVTLALALAFEAGEEGAMRRPPRGVGEALIGRFLAWRLVLVTVLMVAASFGLFLWQLDAGAGIDKARTVAVNMLVAAESVYLFNTRQLEAPGWTMKGLFGGRAVLIATGAVLLMQVGFTYLPVMQTLFGVTPLGLIDWAAIAAVAVLIFLVVEIEKLAVRRRRA
ncbi:cation-translocating P-type ATPase [Oceanibacterium hippocampi]|uniref:Putative cation-transporting ATPase F n=1 Tax=Oceanibacterium hippocampi TaxID=745714 RepID=A0A1Y5TBR6_9PROT|nr:HAD-IC family P-type ATPase [Oceanibacterium hippocampi]SLN58340.1 putative cation-transporting ATPase F [Oceanibacterium hippocampi]